MSLRFMRLMEEIRAECGFPLPLSSAYRCPTYNDAISSTGLTGPHTTGRTVDVRIYGERAVRLLQVALEYGMTGIGVSQKGDRNDRFIHLDDLTTSPRPWVWSY